MQEVSSFSDNLSLVPATAAVRGKSRSSLSSHQALRALVGELFDLLSINRSSMYDRDGGVNAAITPRSISASPRSPLTLALTLGSDAMVRSSLHSCLRSSQPLGSTLCVSSLGHSCPNMPARRRLASSDREGSERVSFCYSATE